MVSKCVAVNKTDVIFMGRQVWWKLTCIWLSLEMVEGFSRDKLLVRVGGVIHFDFKHHTGKREKEYIMWKTITPAACMIIGMGLAVCSCRQKSPVWLSSWCTSITSFMCHVITGNTGSSAYLPSVEHFYVFYIKQDVRLLHVVMMLSWFYFDSPNTSWGGSTESALTVKAHYVGLVCKLDARWWPVLVSR